MFGKSKKEEVKETKKKDEDWMTKKWRPMMAIMYMFCCLADFFLFPIMFTVVQFWETQAANDAFRQWVPITLQGGGLFHVAMGAVLGVSAYGRTQEKLNGAANSPSTLPTMGVPTPTLSSATASPQPAFGAQAQAGFGSSPSWGSPTPTPVTNSWGSQPLGGFGGGDVAMNSQGKKMVPSFEQPLI